MVRVVGARLLGSLGAVFGASLISFILLRLLPGNPARTIVGPFASDQVVRDQYHAMGLDQPVWVQYWRYISQFFRGDWGFSYSVGEVVTKQITERLPASIELGLYAFLFAFVFAVALALLSTYRRRPVVDGTVRTVSFFGLGTPPFWLGLLLLLAFFVEFHLLPGPEGRLSSGTAAPPSVTGLYTIDALVAGQWATLWDAVKHLILPAVTLGFAPFAFLVRLLRTSLLEVAREPFLTVARSKGLSRWTAARRHALPNAFLPTLTAAGLVLAQLLAGSVLVEQVFDWPGMGNLIVKSISAKDFAVVQAFILIAALAYVVVNLIVDLLYGIIDPRLRTQGGAR